MNLQFWTILLLELLDPGRNVSFDEGGIVPVQFGEGSGGDVFPRFV